MDSPPSPLNPGSSKHHHHHQTSVDSPPGPRSPPGPGSPPSSDPPENTFYSTVISEQEKAVRAKDSMAEAGARAATARLIAAKAQKRAKEAIDKLGHTRTTFELTCIADKKQTEADECEIFADFVTEVIIASSANFGPLLDLPTTTSITSSSSSAQPFDITRAPDTLPSQSLIYTTARTSSSNSGPVDQKPPGDSPFWPSFAHGLSSETSKRRATRYKTWSASSSDFDDFVAGITSRLPRLSSSTATSETPRPVSEIKLSTISSVRKKPQPAPVPRSPQPICNQVVQPVSISQPSVNPLPPKSSFNILQQRQSSMPKVATQTLPSPVELSSAIRSVFPAISQNNSASSLDESAENGCSFRKKRRKQMKLKVKKKVRCEEVIVISSDSEPETDLNVAEASALTADIHNLSLNPVDLTKPSRSRISTSSPPSKPVTSQTSQTSLTSQTIPKSLPIATRTRPACSNNSQNLAFRSSKPYSFKSNILARFCSPTSANISMFDQPSTSSTISTSSAFPTSTITSPSTSTSSSPISSPSPSIPVPSNSRPPPPLTNTLIRPQDCTPIFMATETVRIVLTDNARHELLVSRRHKFAFPYYAGEGRLDPETVRERFHDALDGVFNVGELEAIVRASRVVAQHYALNPSTNNVHSPGRNYKAFFVLLVPVGLTEGEQLDVPTLRQRMHDAFDDQPHDHLIEVLATAAEIALNLRTTVRPRFRAPPPPRPSRPPF